MARVIDANRLKGRDRLARISNLAVDQTQANSVQTRFAGVNDRVDHILSLREG